MPDRSEKTRIVSDRLSEQVRVLAMSSTSSRRVGCILLKKGRPVVSTVNLEGKTHPTQAKFSTRAGEPYRKSLHAEIRALIKARVEVDTLVVGRVNKKNELCLSKPCSACQLAIAEMGIKRVYYTADGGGWEKLELPS